jgi:hypothetical protein
MDQQGLGAHWHSLGNSIARKIPTPVGAWTNNLIIFIMYMSVPPFISSAQLVSHKSVAPGTILRGSQLIHLGDALLEFLVLTLLVAVSLIL